MKIKEHPTDRLRREHGLKLIVGEQGELIPTDLKTNKPVSKARALKYFAADHDEFGTEYEAFTMHRLKPDIAKRFQNGQGFDKQIK